MVTKSDQTSTLDVCFWPQWISGAMYNREPAYIVIHFFFVTLEVLNES